MKVKDEFYTEANQTLNDNVSQYVEDMSQFLTICGEIFNNVNFGDISQEVLQEIYHNIYNTVTAATAEANEMLVQKGTGFVSAINSDDCMH